MLNLDDKTKVELAEIKLEIKLLSRERDKIADEVVSFNKTSSVAKSQLDKEINQLKLLKNMLLGQIKSLGSTLPELKNYRKEVIDGIEVYSKEKKAQLEGITSNLNTQISSFKNNLADKDREFAGREEFWSDFADYFTQLSEILSVEEASLASKTADLDKRAMDVSLAEEKASGAIEQAEKRLSLFQSKVKVAEERYLRADSLAAGLEKDITKENKLLKEIRRKLSLKEKTLSAEQKSLKTKEKELLELKRLIEDKDKALNRKVKELGIVI